MGKTFFLVEDHPLYAEGLRRLLESQGQLRCMGQARGEAEALAAITDHPVDLVVIDLSLRQGDGLSLLRQLRARAPQTHCVILTMADDAAASALSTGAARVLSKSAEPAQLLAEIRSVLFPSVRSPADPLAALTEREMEVLRLIGAGLPTREIAQQLFISTKTVETHRMRIKHKLKVDNLYELIRYAVQRLDGAPPP